MAPYHELDSSESHKWGYLEGLPNPYQHANHHIQRLWSSFFRYFLQNQGGSTFDLEITFLLLWYSSQREVHISDHGIERNKMTHIYLDAFCFSGLEFWAAVKMCYLVRGEWKYICFPCTLESIILILGRVFNNFMKLCLLGMAWSLS